jgi:hypothetical protein
MDFVYDIDLMPCFAGGVIGSLAEVADIIHAGVAGGVNLYDIQSPALSYCLAHGAGIARFTFAIAQAINCLSQDAPGGGLTRSSGAAKKVGVRDAFTDEGIKQRLRYLLLTNYLS